MADFHQKIGPGPESLMKHLSAADIAADQLMIVQDDFTGWTEEHRDLLHDATVNVNLAAAHFIKEIAEAIREDRLVILDLPRRGQGMILTPAASTFHEQLEAMPDDISDMSIGEFNRKMGLKTEREFPDA